MTPPKKKPATRKKAAPRKKAPPKPPTLREQLAGTVPVKMSHIMLHTGVLIGIMLIILGFEINGKFQSDIIQHDQSVIQQKITPLCLTPATAETCRGLVHAASVPVVRRLCRVVLRELGKDTAICERSGRPTSARPSKRPEKRPASTGGSNGSESGSQQTASTPSGQGPVTQPQPAPASPSPPSSTPLNTPSSTPPSTPSGGGGTGSTCIAGACLNIPSAPIIGDPNDTLNQVLPKVGSGGGSPLP